MLTFFFQTKKKRNSKHSKNKTFNLTKKSLSGKQKNLSKDQTGVRVPKPIFPDRVVFPGRDAQTRTRPCAVFLSRAGILRTTQHGRPSKLPPANPPASQPAPPKLNPSQTARLQVELGEVLV
jgi:hypothetical protein